MRAFQWHAGGSAPREVPADQVLPGRGDGWVWIDAADGDSDGLIAIGRELGIEEHHLAEAIARTNYPLVEETHGYVAVVIQGFSSSPQGRLRFAEIDLFAGPDFLLTVRSGELPSVDQLIDRIEEGTLVETPTPSDLFAHLALVSARRYLPLIKGLEVQIDALEDLAMNADPRVITEVHALRRDLIVMERALRPQQMIYDELADSRHDILSKEAKRLFRRVSSQLSRVLESLEAGLSLLGSVVETHRGAVADQTNAIFRVLTVFSAILLPLGLIAGIWGMNFSELPLAARERGFWIMIGIMAFIALSLWIYFGRRGFVGAPRLSELPKSVGLGLVEIGTAPIKIVAGGIESTVRTVGRGIGLTGGGDKSKG
jgi:magnesium transporter